jgi:hypothetical protein
MAFFTAALTTALLDVLHAARIGGAIIATWRGFTIKLRIRANIPLLLLIGATSTAIRN